jgi:hypothetical protein
LKPSKLVQLFTFLFIASEIFCSPRSIKKISPLSIKKINVFKNIYKKIDVSIGYTYAAGLDCVSQKLNIHTPKHPKTQRTKE